MLKYKLIYLIIMTALLIGVHLFLPPYYQVTFVLRHTVTFIFAASVIVLMVKALNKGLIRKYHHILNGQKLRIFNSLTIVFIGVMLFGVTIIQNQYIENYETASDTKYCLYFDDYGNYVHGSMISFQCPDLDVKEQNDERFIFQATYEVDNTDYDLEGITYSNIKEAFIKVDVEIEYYEGIIKNIFYQSSRQYTRNEYNDLLETYEENSQYSSVYLEITNAFDDEKIIQTKTGDIHRSAHDYDQVDAFDHYDFSLVNPMLDSTLVIDYYWDHESLLFEVNALDDTKDYKFDGHLETTLDYTTVTINNNPKRMNVDPKERYNTIQFLEDRTVLESFSREHIETEYTPFKDAIDFVKARANIGEQPDRINSFYDRGEFSIAEGIWSHRINDTNHGHMLQHFGNEDTFSSNLLDSEIRHELNTHDMDIFSFNPDDTYERFTYSTYWFLELNPALEYLIYTFEK